MPSPTNLVQALDRLIRLFGGSGQSGSLLHGINRIGDALESNPVLSNSHGDLDNLNADDHPHYHTDQRGDARYYPRSELTDSLNKVAANTTARHNHDNLNHLNTIDQNLAQTAIPTFGGQKALALDYAAANNGKVLGVVSGALSWVDGGNGTTSVNAGVAIFSDTTGGAFTAGAWRTRTLNSHEGDTSLATLANNTVTINRAGTYLCHFEADGYAVRFHQARLSINSSTHHYGRAAYADYSGNGHNCSTLWAVLQLSANDVMVLEHYCSSTYHWGYGIYSQPWMSDRKYAQLLLMRLS